MSLGIKSIWRTGFRRIGAPGALCLRTSGLRSRASSLQPFSTDPSEQAASPESRPLPPLHESPTPLTDSESESQLQVQAQLIQTNHARNQLLRDAFRANTPNTKDAVERKLSSPYVPTARDYPSSRAAQISKAQSHKVARVQVGFDTIWKHFGSHVPEWTETFSLLKRMTPKRSEIPKMAAVRVVLPESWDMAIGNKRVEFVDATTGLATKLRVSADHQNPSAIVLRGESSVLAKAADELIASCPEVEIFRLGEVATFDYKAKRLWPAIDDAADGGLALPIGRRDNIWLHRELQTFWIDKPYEQTPRPKWWTKQSFETYISALVCGRLRPHLAMEFYKQPRKDGKLVDTDGIRIGLILSAFEDPSAREFISPSVLKMAIAFMAQKGGHRASADRLFTLAEDWGLPMDTEIFNVMLEGYVAKRDVAFFHKFLHKMETRYFYPNARTWLLFLKLVQRDDERRQIIAAMYEIGLFEDPATRRGIAEVMASYDAYAAFKAGKKLDMFMSDQSMRYGEDWFTVGSLNQILNEFFRFHDSSKDGFSDFKPLLEKQPEDGRKVDITTVNTVLKHCSDEGDWTTALWMLAQMPLHGWEPNRRTYQLLISLAIREQTPSALGVIFLYGVLDRKLRKQAREAMQPVLLKQLPGPMWSNHPVRIFSSKMARSLQHNKISRPNVAVAGAEWAILKTCDGYKPVKPLSAALDTVYRTVDRPLKYHLFGQGRDPEGESIIQSHDYAVKLRDPSGKKPGMMVHLDSGFDPQTMVRDQQQQSAASHEVSPLPREGESKDSVKPA